MKEPKPATRSEDRGARPRQTGPLSWVFFFLLLGLIVVFFTQSWSEQSEIEFSFFEHELDANNIESVEFHGQVLLGQFKTRPPAPAADAETEASSTDDEPQFLPRRFLVILPPLLGEAYIQKLQEKEVRIKAVQPTDYGNLLMLIWLVALLVVFIVVWSVFRRTRDQVMGGGMISGVIRSPARKYDDDTDRVTFNDIAGLEGVKSDLQEIIDYLKSPEKFHRLGATVPKGVLLMGPPGTGKTLLARAIAGEAQVPFYSINGSEFIQLFVGVGAGRVRDLFKTATENAPSIVFVDEIDAVGRQRGAGLGGGHDEREQTLNQILSEMDGFQSTSTVIVLAATNRPDVLDPALLRPGRFDRHITVDRPNVTGREELFAVHSRHIPLTEDVNFRRLARGTVGLTGADIRNLVNEAALWATRQGKDKVDMSDFEHARDKVLMGSKRDDVLTDEEKETTSYHEAGHAVLAWFIPGSDRVHKVTIIPRGRALGVTQLVPEEDRHNLKSSDLQARLAVLLGGRAAEQIQFDQVSSGAENDLEEATRLARRMVTHWGMSERLGPVAYHTANDHPFLGREIAKEHREFSDHTSQIIDDEVAKILHAAADRARRTLVEHQDKLKNLAAALQEREVLDEDELEGLLGPSVNRAHEEGGEHRIETGVDAASAVSRQRLAPRTHPPREL